MDFSLESSQEYHDLKIQRKNKSKINKRSIAKIFLLVGVLTLTITLGYFLFENLNGNKSTSSNLFLNNSKKYKKILVIGSIGYDLITFFDKFPIEGETISGLDFHENPGGKGNNQAIASSRAGAPVSFLGAIGDDNYGQIDKKLLEDSGVKPYLKVVPKTPTQIATILVDKSGANRIIIVGGANLKVDKKQIDDNINLIKESDIIIFQLEIPKETVEYAIDKCHQLGKTVILNPAPAYKLNDDIYKKVTYLTPNESELGLLTGMPFGTIDEIKKAGRKLIDKGLKNLIVTVGERGALFQSKNEEELFEAYKVKAIDTTGAGDCFNGVFAAYLAKGYDFKTAIKYANIASSISVTRVGATPSLPYEKEIEEKFKSIKIKISK